jgi:hypothetical protein
MGFTYRNVSRAAYQLAPGAAPWTADYRALPFPEQARSSLLALCNHGLKEGAKPYQTIPTSRMDGVLQSLAPDLIVRGRPSVPHAPGEDYWLYAPAELPHPLPDQTMHSLMAAWLRDLGSKDAITTDGYRKVLLDTFAELKEVPLVWADVLDVDLLGCPVTEGGTATPSPRQYQLATDALARRIMALAPYEFEGGALRFRALPRGPRDQGAELMSQPYMRMVNNKPWWFSITINVSLHTIPFEAQPRLHLHTGVRRWATYPRADTGLLHLAFRRATTVYLSPSIPWLPGAPTSDRYAVARLTRVRGGDDGDAGRVDWVGNGPAGMLRGLSLRQEFPDPAALLSAPLDWLGDGPGVRAAVVHSNHMGAHGIGAGLMSHQRSLITEWAEQALPTGLVRAPQLTRSTVGSDKPANVRSNATGAAKKTEEARAARARRRALAVSTQAQPDGASPNAAEQPPVVEARLLWQTAELRTSAIDAFAEILGLDGDGGAPQPDHSNPDAVAEEFDSATPGSPVLLQWHTPELTVRLRCLPLSGGLADKLDVDAMVRTKGQALADAVGQRRSELVEFLAADGANPGSPSLALVEIAHRSTFRPSRTDPKFAVRLGCADAGVLTQFAVVPSSAKAIKTHANVDHRVRSGWLDGLRQLGIRVLPEHTLGGNLPEALRYAAVWMVKRRKDGPTGLPLHLPVAVMVTPLPQGGGLAKVQGWDDDTAEWIPYPAFLLGLVKKAEIPDTEPEAIADPAIPGQRADSAAAGVPPLNRRTAWRKNMEQQRKETASFLQRVIFSLEGHPTALITHSQNSRNHWPWLQDSKTVVDLIKPGHAGAAGLDQDLRLVRIRSGSGRETPQWWGTDSPDGINGLPAGLWTEDHAPGTDQRVFYSTTEKASQFTASAARADRLAPRVLTRGKNVGQLTSDAGVPAWNPALVEIAVLGCHPDAEGSIPGDKPEALALAMHQLRQAPDYLDALSLPLPLHLAGLAQAYVLPMFADDEEEEASEDDDGPAADVDPDLVAAPGLAQAPEPESEPEGQLSLFG